MNLSIIFSIILIINKGDVKLFDLAKRNLVKNHSIRRKDRIITSLGLFDLY